MLLCFCKWVCSALRPALAMLGLCLGLVVALGAGGAQACQVPAELLSVARTLAALPTQATSLSAAMTNRLAGQMDAISESRIVTHLNEAGLDSISPLAVDVLAEAERLANGANYNPARLEKLLSDLDQQSTLACIGDGKSIFQGNQQGRDGGFFVEKGFSWSEINRRAEQEKLFAAGAVVIAMTGFISILVLIDFAYRWIMALLYNRKACRIPVDLLVRGRVIEGVVITLGKGGCRFHPLDTLVFDEALADLRSSDASIVIEEFELLVRCSSIHETVADFRFDKPISIKCQRQILEHSTISPFFIRKSRNGGEDATAHLLS